MEHSCFQGKHKFHNFDKFTYMCYNCYNYHNLLITSASTKRQPSMVNGIINQLITGGAPPCRPAAPTRHLSCTTLPGARPWLAARAKEVDSCSSGQKLARLGGTLASENCNFTVV
jgi:hypothetical protein